MFATNNAVTLGLDPRAGLSAAHTQTPCDGASDPRVKPEDDGEGKAR